MSNHTLRFFSLISLESDRRVNGASAWRRLLYLLFERIHILQAFKKVCNRTLLLYKRAFHSFDWGFSHFFGTILIEQAIIFVAAADQDAAFFQAFSLCLDFYFLHERAFFLQSFSALYNQLGLLIFNLRLLGRRKLQRSLDLPDSLSATGSEWAGFL